MINQINLAAQIATKANQGQTRWDGKTPYITHPAAVANALAEKEHSDDIIAIAWLHDVLEDTDITVQDLLDQGVDHYIVDVVVVLTKYGDINYLDYILDVREDTAARIVKAADIRHNMSCFKPGKRTSLYQKYELALYILGDY